MKSQIKKELRKATIEASQIEGSFSTLKASNVTAQFISTPLNGNVSTPNVFANNVTGNVTGNVNGNATSATQLQTTRTIAGESFNGTQNVELSLSNLSDGNTVVAASGNNTFTGNNTFNGNNTFSNVITGNITGNSMNSSFTGFFGRLNSQQIRPTGNANKFPVGPWRIDADNGSAGRRNTWSENMTLSASNTRVDAGFSLPSGIYQISAMVRVIDYEPADGELILFFSTAGTNFSGSVNTSFPQSVSTRRVLQDQSITMNLNCCIKLTSTTTCGLMMQPTVADNNAGFTINDRSWLSVVKLRDV